MLQVEGVSVHYGRIQAVREVSLHVEPGEIVTMVGANGAGKSSLLNAIGGVVPISAGRIRWEDRDISGLPSHAISRIGISYVPEGRQLLPSMNVLDNLLLGSYVHYVGRWRRLLSFSGSILKDTRVRESLERVFRLFPILEERQRQVAGTLSGGQQQMLAIGRALMSSPRILLMDEPSVGLAPQLVREIFALVARLREEGLTILLAEQDALGAMKVADRGYVLERGRVAADGPATELIGDDRVRRAYLGKAKVRVMSDES
jgi:branched-chain amino acid transport system ATP-binding protein